MLDVFMFRDRKFLLSFGELGCSVTADSLAPPAVCSQQQTFVFNLTAGGPSEIKNSNTPQAFELTVMTGVSQCAINTHMPELHKYARSTHMRLLFLSLWGLL